jgi:hypothetical protein
MSYQHKGLAGGRWKEMSLLEQMSNIGSEVDRALTWKAKNNVEYCQKAFERALELLDLSLESTSEFPRLKELARTREGLVDYFWGDNEYRTTENQWRRYFLYFALALRANC